MRKRCRSNSLVIGQPVEEFVDVADADERGGVQVREDLQQDLWRESARRKKRKKTYASTLSLPKATYFRCLVRVQTEC